MHAIICAAERSQRVKSDPIRSPRTCIGRRLRGWEDQVTACDGKAILRRERRVGVVVLQAAQMRENGPTLWFATTKRVGAAVGFSWKAIPTTLAVFDIIFFVISQRLRESISVSAACIRIVAYFLCSHAVVDVIVEVESVMPWKKLPSRS